MQFDFDTIQNRRNTNSMKWDVKEQELPMWVADMDFKTAPAVIEALQERVNTGIYGYSIVPDAWYEAYQKWWERRHHLRIEKEWLTFCTGIVPAISCAVRRMTNIGDNVVIQTPVYNIFFNSILNHGRHILENKLVYDGSKYEIDFTDLENKLSHPNTTMMILCNPHNPVGKIWSRQELEKIGNLCAKHHVLVLSDEIHCDITNPGKNYVPFASVSKACANNSISCIAASKAFNLAGLQSAATMIPEEGIRNKMVRGLNSSEIAEPNAFAMEGTIAALKYGEAWLEELRTYIYENCQLVRSVLEKELPEVKVVESEATYLLWLDCKEVPGDAVELCEFIRKETGLYLSEGEEFGDRDFIRMNVACPRSQVEEGLRRFQAGVKAYTQQKLK